MRTQTESGLFFGLGSESRVSSNRWEGGDDGDQEPTLVNGTISGVDGKEHMRSAEISASEVGKVAHGGHQTISARCW